MQLKLHTRDPADFHSMRPAGRKKKSGAARHRILTREKERGRLDERSYVFGLKDLVQCRVESPIQLHKLG